MIFPGAILIFILSGISLIPLGCSYGPRGVGFSEVQKMVLSRDGLQIHWNQGMPGDAQILETIDKILKEEISCEGAVKVALLLNPSLQATYEELGVSQADLQQALRFPNPTLFTSAGFPDRSPFGVALRFDVALDFLNLLLLPARKHLAVDEFEKMKLTVADRVLRLAAETRRAYYEALGAQQIASMRKLIVEASEVSYELARRMHAAGNLSELDLAREQNQMEEARMTFAKNELRAREKRERLNRIMGVWGKRTAWRLPNQLPDLPSEEITLQHLESFAIAHRLDLQGAWKELEIRARTLGLSQEWRFLPGGQIGVGADRGTDGQWVVGPSLSLTLPLFDQSQAQMGRHEALLRKEMWKLTALALEIRAEVRETRERMVYYRRLAEHYRSTVIPLREKIVQLVQREYNYMLSGAFDLLAAKRQELDAYQDYIETVAAYWATRADLQRALGGRFPRPEEVRADSDPSPLYGAGNPIATKASGDR